MTFAAFTIAICAFCGSFSYVGVGFASLPEFFLTECAIAGDDGLGL